LPNSYARSTYLLSIVGEDEQKTAIRMRLTIEARLRT
jgi:hypothetical protein